MAAVATCCALAGPVFGRADLPGVNPPRAALADLPGVNPPRAL
jgi:hypothetical protein